MELFDRLIENKSNLVKVNYYINGELRSHIATLEQVIPFIGIKTSFYYIPFIGENVALESVVLYDTNEELFRNSNIEGYNKDSDEDILEGQKLLYGENSMEHVSALPTALNRRLKALDLYTIIKEFITKDNKIIKVNNPILEDLYIDGIEHYSTYDENGNLIEVFISKSRTRK